MSLLDFHEDALPRRQFQALARKVVGLGSERLRSTYQTTFWFPLRGAVKPGSVVEEAALALRAHVPTRGVIGVEWWLSRMKTTNVQVDFHVDRDEKLARRTGEIISPKWSSVFFLNLSVGGLLAVTSAPPVERNVAKAPDQVDFDLAAPKPNRFVVFRGAMTHGVLDARNEIPSRRIRMEVGIRYAIIFNWWQRRPEGVPTFAESKVYRSLAVRR
jgi:hypothetical protein